jgi:hypothetical protein
MDVAPEIPGVGHLPQVQAFEDFARTLLIFLEVS